MLYLIVRKEKLYPGSKSDKLNITYYKVKKLIEINYDCIKTHLLIQKLNKFFIKKN